MCVNEAAIVAAGFKYRPVHTADDCPKSFSRVIAKYAICLNEAMSDNLRQELLLPFVTRLAGSADTKRVEAQRREYITIQTVNRILPIGCRGSLLSRREVTQQCEAARTLDEARSAMRHLRAVSVQNGKISVKCAAAFNAPPSGLSAVWIAYSVHGNEDLIRRVYEIAAEILDGALRIGNRTTVKNTIKRVERLEAAKMKMTA
jgi:hypothetical protein